MGHIICGNCHYTHNTVDQVKSCYGIIQSRNASTPFQKAAVTPDAITDKQLAYIKDVLGGDAAYAAKLTKREASAYIDRLKKAGSRTVKDESKIATAPNRQTTIVPLDMLRAAIAPGREGRFAVRADSTKPYVFFRITTPKSGKFSGCLKVQTQHGPDYDLMMAVWPSGQITMYDKRWEQDLLLVVVDPNGGKIAYGQELQHCGICGTELTDERSRYYGIGPDCETRYRHLIAMVDGTKGPYRPGQ